MTSAFLRIARASSSSPLTSRSAIFIGDRIPPTSVEWMLDVTSTTTLPSPNACRVASPDANRGSLSARCIAW